MTKDNNLIVAKNQDNSYTFYLTQTIEQNQGLTGDEVKGFSLEAGKGYQINNNLKIYLLDNIKVGLGLELCFLNDKSIRNEYLLLPHPKLKDFYLIENVKEEFLEEIIKDKRSKTRKTNDLSWVLSERLNQTNRTIKIS